MFAIETSRSNFWWYGQLMTIVEVCITPESKKFIDISPIVKIDCKELVKRRNMLQQHEYEYENEESAPQQESRVK